MSKTLAAPALITLFSLSAAAPAFEPLHGEFVAQEACPARTSTKKATNPGRVRLEADEHYAVSGRNKPNGRYLQLWVPGARPELRLAFLLRLLLPSPRLRHMAKVVTAFTLALSLTLGLAANGWVAPCTVIEPAIALSIAYVGALGRSGAGGGGMGCGWRSASGWFTARLRRRPGRHPGDAGRRRRARAGSRCASRESDGLTGHDTCATPTHDTARATTGITSRYPCLALSAAKPYKPAFQSSLQSRPYLPGYPHPGPLPVGLGE